LGTRTLIILAVSWIAFSVVGLGSAATYEISLLGFLFFFLSGVWFLLLASLLESQRGLKHLQGRQWTLVKTMCIIALILPPVILLQILLVTSMLPFFYGLIIVGFLVGWKARSSWIALYATLLAALVSATVLVLYFYVEPSIPTYLDYITTLGFYTIIFFGSMVPSAVLGIAVGYWQRTKTRRHGMPSMRSPGGVDVPGARRVSRFRQDGRVPLGMGSGEDRGQRSVANVVLLVGLSTAMIGGFIHDPSSRAGRYEESLTWQWVSISGAQIALLGAGIRAGVKPVLGLGRALLVGGLVAAWFAALAFDPSPILSWGNIIPLLVFVPASIYSVLYTLAANYLI